VSARTWGFKSPFAHNVITDRPRSRRRRFLWPLLLSAVVLAALVLARINDQAIAAVNHLDDIRQSANRLVTAAAAFGSLSEDIGTMERAEFQTITDSVVAELDGAGSVVSEPPESGNLVGAATLYRLTVSSWRSGVVAFAQGVIEMADEGGTGEERIYAGLQEVAAGDVLYLRFLEELDRPEVPDPIASMPGLRFLPTTITPVSLARLYATAAGAQNSLLALRADLAVGQVTSRPELVTNPNGDLVVSSAELLSVDVVVANRGNVNAPAQVLNLELLSPESSDNRTVDVPELSPGGQTTVTIEDLPVVPGQTYQLGVALALTVADGDPTNNAISLTFIVNEPTA
jgi:CARDB protein